MGSERISFKTIHKCPNVDPSKPWRGFKRLEQARTRKMTKMAYLSEETEKDEKALFKKRKKKKNGKD